MIGVIAPIGSAEWVAKRYSTRTGGVDVPETGFGLSDTQLRELKAFTNPNPAVEVSISAEAKALYLSMVEKLK